MKSVEVSVSYLIGLVLYRIRICLLPCLVFIKSVASVYACHQHSVLKHALLLHKCALCPDLINFTLVLKEAEKMRSDPVSSCACCDVITIDGCLKFEVSPLLVHSENFIIYYKLKYIS